MTVPQAVSLEVGSARRVMAALLVLTALLSAPAAAPAAEAPEIARDVLSDSAFQRDLPTPRHRPIIRESPNPTKPQPTRALSLDWLYSSAKLLLYGLIAAAAIGFAVYVYRLVADRRHAVSDDRDQITPPNVALPAEVADPTLREADALAEQGRFAEAVHLLLGVALSYLKSKIAPGLSAALTSREVIDVVDMGRERRAALLDIVGTVEVSHFGGRPVDDGGYRRCRSCFAVLTGG